MKINKEEICKNLYDAMPDGIVMTDMQGNILECNKAYADMTGYTKEELLKMTFQQMTPPKWHKVQELVIKNELLPTGKTEAYEKEYIRKDGTVLPISLRGWLVKDDSGNPQIMMGLVRDIVSIKQQETALRQSKERLEQLMINSPAVVYTRKASGDYAAIFISKNIKRQTGYESEDFVENSDFWISHIHPEDAPRVFTEMQDLFNKGYHSLVYRFLCKDGRYIWISDHMVLMSDKEGNPREICGTMLDSLH